MKKIQLYLFCRLSLTSGSFIPSTFRKWNSLDQTVRNVDFISKFKTNLKNSSGHIKSVPVYFSYGPRKLNIILPQIRCSASFLNEDLFKVNIVNSPSCNNCGASLENARHFFLECPTYADIRTVLFDKLSFLPVTDHHLLTSGIAELSTAQNETIFTIQKGLKDFSWYRYITAIPHSSPPLSFLSFHFSLFPSFLLLLINPIFSTFM